ncbi:hypothetical protein [Actinomadura sediminis]|uniref:Peptidase inhibitor family I36 protein n=1 Tax=Actinomadura sediminis TaxID=1038904 RepID=A0ABW3EQY2_9ACTN
MQLTRQAIVGAFAVPALALGAGLLTAGPAGADSTRCKRFYVSGGWGCYQSKGDIVRVHDTKWDGSAVRVVWRTADGRKGRCWDPDSEGDARKCNYNFKETYKGRDNLITYQVQAVDGGEVWDTSGWQGVST